MPGQTQEKKESEELVTKGYLDKKLDEKLGNFASKEYLDLRFDEFEEKIDEKTRAQTAILLQAVDRVMTKFDRQETEEAAHDLLHRRTEDTLHDHGRRIGLLETGAKI